MSSYVPLKTLLKHECHLCLEPEIFPHLTKLREILNREILNLHGERGYIGLHLNELIVQERFAATLIEHGRWFDMEGMSLEAPYEASVDAEGKEHHTYWPLAYTDTTAEREVAKFWRKGGVIDGVATGWALLWGGGGNLFPHSWGMKDHKIVETEPMCDEVVAYFGVEYQGKDADIWASDQLGSFTTEQKSHWAEWCWNLGIARMDPEQWGIPTYVPEPAPALA